MALRIININIGTDPEDEYIMMKAHSGANLAEYAIVNRHFLTKEPDKKIMHFNFPNIRIKRGEYIMLVSGVGEDRRYTDIEGDTIHKFYWNSNHCLWNTSGEEAVLIHYQVISEYMIHNEEANKKAS